MLKVDIEKKINAEKGEAILTAKASFEAGCVSGIFGNSGQGKTTLFNIIAGIAKADSGSIVMNDTLWFDSAKNINIPIQMRNIGYIFQTNSLFPNFTIQENITFALSKEKRKETNFNAVLEQVGLQELANKYPNQLSGGQQQRAAIARVLVQEAKLVLIDEPFTGLDMDIKVKLMKQIKELSQKRNLIVLIISHHVHDISQLCDSVYMIEDHRLAERLDINEFDHLIKERIQTL